MLIPVVETSNGLLPVNYFHSNMSSLSAVIFYEDNRAVT